MPPVLQAHVYDDAWCEQASQSHHYQLHAGGVQRRPSHSGRIPLTHKNQRTVIFIIMIIKIIIIVIIIIIVDHLM